MSHEPAGGGPPELTADECVRAGMYWFGRNDFPAAEAWWRRALYLEPNHVRAQECLRLLAKSTGRSDNPDPPPREEIATPDLIERISSRRPSSEDIERRLFGDQEQPPPEPAIDIDAAAWALGQARETPTDPFEFATDIPEDTGDIIRVDAGTPVPTLERTPWDEGPARTSVVNVRVEDEHDPIAEPTPLPEVERAEFFGRAGEYDPEFIGTLEEPSEIVLSEESGPVKLPPGFSDDVDIRIDDPVEAATATPPGTAIPISPEALLDQAKDLFALHDFSGAIDRLEKLTEMAPNHAEGRSMLAQCRSQLMRMLESKIGDLDKLPRLLISSEEVIWLNLNHRAGFILSQIDGSVTYDDIIALSGMPRLDTLRILVELIQNRVIGAD